MGELRDSRRTSSPSSRNAAEWKRADRCGSSLCVEEGTVLESLSCNRGDLHNASILVLGGGGKSVLLYASLPVYLLTRVAYGCKFASLRYRGYDVGRIRSNVAEMLASQRRIWWNAPIKIEGGLSCFRPKRKRRASYGDSFLASFFLF